MEPETVDAAGEQVLSHGEALVYGLIQGLTEFLPVSSSGHLAIAHRLELGTLPRELELPFDVLLHGATLVAIAVAFRRELWAAYRPGAWRLWPILGIAILPAGLVGLLAKGHIEVAGKHLWVIGCCYVLTALLLFVSERRSQRVEASGRAPTVAPERITWRQALQVGSWQVLGLLPGVSRSGSTIAGGMLAGLAPGLAVAFSFLIGLPLIAAAAAKDAIEGRFALLVEAVGWGPLGTAVAAALLSGLLAIELLKLLVGSRRLVWFAGYCMLVALACFVMELWP